jgi:hypothetical protein
LSTLIDGLIAGIAQIELDDIRTHKELKHDGCRDDGTDAKKHHRAEGPGKEGTISTEYIYGSLGKPKERYIAECEVEEQYG